MQSRNDQDYSRGDDDRDSRQLQKDGKGGKSNTSEYGNYGMIDDDLQQGKDAHALGSSGPSDRQSEVGKKSEQKNYPNESNDSGSHFSSADKSEIEGPGNRTIGIARNAPASRSKDDLKDESTGPTDSLPPKDLT